MATTRMQSTLRAAVLVAAAFGAACSSTPEGPAAAARPSAATTTSEDQRFERLVAEFMPAFWKQNPAWAIQVGVYDHAAILEPYDQRAREKEAAFYAEWSQRLSGFEPTRLSVNNRTDLGIIRGRIAAGEWYLTTFKAWQWQPSSYNVAGPFEVLINTEYAPLEQRLRTLSIRMASVPAYYAAAQANITTPSLEHTDLAIVQNKGAIAFFGDLLIAKAKASALTDAEKSEFEHLAGAARKAIELYVQFLEGMRPKLAAGEGVRSFRIGSELYERKFMLDYVTGFTAREVYERALKEKAWLHDQMALRAAALWPKYFPNATAPADRLVMIRRLLDKLSLQHVKPEEFMSTVRTQISELEKFVRERDLLDQDASRPLKVRETPPHKRGFGPPAALDAPGPYDPTRESFYNVSPLDEMTPEQKESYLREYNQWVLQIMSIHEAVPGHYTQSVHANKSKSVIKSVFGDGAMDEGWAVYAERMMLEAGYGGDSPEMWLFWMKWNLRVVCNAILDNEVHTQGLTRERAMELLLREAFQQEAEASQKWRRATLSSAQLASYFAGYTAIWQFQQEERARLGSAFSLKTFNNRFLSYGTAPVPMIKQLIRAGG